MTTISIISWIQTHTGQTVALYSVRIFVSVSAKKTTLDMLSHVLSPGTLYILQEYFNTVLSQVDLCTKARGTCLLIDCTLGMQRAHDIRLQSYLLRVVGSLLLRSEALGRLFVN